MSYASFYDTYLKSNSSMVTSHRRRRDRHGAFIFEGDRRALERGERRQARRASTGRSGARTTTTTTMMMTTTSAAVVRAGEAHLLVFLTTSLGRAVENPHALTLARLRRSATRTTHIERAQTH